MTDGTPSSPRRRVLAAAASLGIAGCLGGPGASAPTDTPASTTRAGTATATDTATATEIGTETATETPDEPEAWQPASGSPLAASVEPEVLVKNLEIPWDAAFADDGSIYLTERQGRVVRSDGDGVTEAIDLEGVHTIGNAGALGLAFHPDDADRLYVYYTTKQSGMRVNRIVSYDVGADAPAETAEVVVDGIPGGVIHNGGDITFGPDGALWVPTGEGGAKSRAQDPESLAGKVLRLTPGGDPAPGNPDVEGADPRIYTLGHRNPQGLSFLPDGRVLLNEHGPTGRDEVNLLTAGGNYGWPEARDESGYAGTDFHRPVVNTGPNETWAPSGSVFYTGEAIPEWHNRFLTGGLISQQVVAVTLTRPDADLPPAEGGATRYDADWLSDAYVATAHHILEGELGRIRRVLQGPDGEVYALTSNRDGRAKAPFPKERDDVLVRLRSN